MGKLALPPSSNRDASLSTPSRWRARLLQRRCTADKEPRALVAIQHVRCELLVRWEIALIPQ